MYWAVMSSSLIDSDFLIPSAVNFSRAESSFWLGIRTVKLYDNVWGRTS